MWFRVIMQSGNTWVPVLTIQRDYQRAGATLETFRRSGKQVHLLFAGNQEALDTLTINYHRGSISAVSTVSSVQQQETAAFSDEVLIEDTLPDVMSDPLVWRRIAIEHGPGDDRDQPYVFALPEAFPQRLAWARLLGKVQRGELEP